ncbi:hypothetical protein [Butyrivibrio sp. MC2013]|uniref:hypothetical protein n=1 Tax=Butyrivibrio sp. MC2013 TaxID=1280686 RepID=UPI00040B0904|nr:hypothetical protein [Butyrivibrio sp. MC2013]
MSGISISGAYFGYGPATYSPVAAGRDSGAGLNVNAGESDVKKAGRRSSPAECETCSNRKYQDGSDENVSFKTAQKMSPSVAAVRVRAHEQEHVSNAYDKAKENGGEVIRASVQIHTAVCPECGRTYVSGGVTNSQIKYTKEENPYQKAAKKAYIGLMKGANVDMAV